MSDIRRYAVGTLLIFAAMTLLEIHQELWSLLPAIAAIYVLGSLLYEKLFP